MKPAKAETVLDEVKRVSQNARCLFNEAEVEAALDQMAHAISTALGHSNPVVLCIMNGGLIVTGKLLPRLNFPLQLDYVHATRYRDKTTGSQLQWKAYNSLSLQGRTVLLIDDIFDQGATLEKVVQYCEQQGARIVQTAVLVEKQHQRKLTTLKPDFIGLSSGDFYLYGYGLHYKGYLRNAAGIFAVDQQDLA